MNTRVGYTGGEYPDPTYNTVCAGDGHTEAIKIDYDPSQTSYEELLDVFWEEHNPTYRSKPQYKSAIWPQDKKQEEIAAESKRKLEENFGKELATDIDEPKTWYDAEEYHQKYFDKMSGRGGSGVFGMW